MSPNEASPIPIPLVRALGMTLLAAGCTTARPMLVPSTATGFTRSDSSSTGPVTWNGRRVLILRPKVTYRDVSTEREVFGPDPNQPWGSNALKSLSSPPLDAPSVSRSLTAFVDQSFLMKGFRVIGPEDPEIQNRPELQEILSKWAQGPEDLLRPWSKNRDRILSELQVVKESLDADAVLVQLMDVKVGTPGTWAAMTSGGVTSETSTSDLTTGLVDTDYGKVVWKREVFFRDIPNAELLSSSLQTMYGDFPVREQKDRGGA